MARLLRSTTTSKLRKPVVVGASVTFPPVQVRLVAVRTSVEQQRHTPKSKLRKPVVVGASVVFRLVARTLAPQPRRPRAPGKNLLRDPTVATAAGVQPLPRPLAVKLARALRPPGTMYGVGGPVVVSLTVPPFAPLEVRLAPSPRQARVPKSSLLGPPSVLPEPAPLDPFAPVDVRLAGSRRPQAVRSVLRAPTVTTEVEPIPRPLVVKLAPARRPARTVSVLMPPQLTTVSGTPTLTHALSYHIHRFGVYT